MADVYMCVKWQYHLISGDRHRIWNWRSDYVLGDQVAICFRYERISTDLFAREYLGDHKDQLDTNQRSVSALGNLGALHDVLWRSHRTPQIATLWNGGITLHFSVCACPIYQLVPNSATTMPIRCSPISRHSGDYKTKPVFSKCLLPYMIFMFPLITGHHLEMLNYISRLFEGQLIVAYQRHRPLTGCAKLRVAHAPGIPGTFSPPPTSKETAS